MNRDLLSLIKSIHINPHNKKHHIHKFDKIVAVFNKDKLHAYHDDLIGENRKLRKMVRNASFKDTTTQHRFSLKSI